MPNNQVQVRRSPASTLDSATPADGELAYDTTNDELRVGDGATAGGLVVPNFRSIITQKYQYASSVGGTANAITLTLPKGSPAYSQGFSVKFKAASTNTGATTVAVDGKSALNVFKISGGTIGAIAAGDILSNGIYEIIHDGTQFILTNPSNNVPTNQAGMVLLQVASPSGAAQVDFTGLGSTYDDYLLETAVSLSSTTTTLRLRLSTGSFFSGTSDYQNQYGTISSTGGFTTGSSGNESSLIICMNPGIPSSPFCFAKTNIHAKSGIVPRIISDALWTGGSTQVPSNRTLATGVFTASTSQIVGMRVLPLAGTITGDIRLYGLRKTV